MQEIDDTCPALTQLLLYSTSSWDAQKHVLTYVHDLNNMIICRTASVTKNISKHIF